METYYVDFYGRKACITEREDGTALLEIGKPSGRFFFRRIYRSLRGAKCALGQHSEGTAKPINRDQYESQYIFGGF